MEIEKVYEPQRIEPHWAEWWASEGLYAADPYAPGERFSIVIPPPNVTGSLHMGHMLDHSTMDAAVRRHRMRGENTLWLPGTDHAGISTQIMVERRLAEEGLTRQQLGREEFERRVWEWRRQYGNRILDQMKRIGDSVDWTRVRFTLDQDLSRAVVEAFVRLYERGLIYRGAYMVNWCPRCNTALSDLEVVHEEVQGHLWHIRYPVIGSDRHLTVATTRPETMLGDTAVAVNPKDQRYADLHGHSVMLPLMNRAIPIICDEIADPEYGTGIVKITPAHDPNDFEAGKRHDLPHVRVIDETGRMTANAGPYAGLDRFAARKRIVADLESLGLVAKIETHVHSVGKCERTKDIVEPLVSTQWFVKTRPLADKASRAVREGAIEFIPENWNKTYFHWMDNIRDWCISRQLWWGHRIPAWHCADCGKITVARTAPAACAHCNSTKIEQDPDVLDTWFSSSLWPFSTLGWPNDTEDLRAYYPTSLLITGFDILFFWVARMIMMGLELTDQVPFKQVHMHGLVRDAERQKMSKTKGNVIDPLDITEKYGTDAVRLALLVSASAGTDIAFSEDRVLSARAFANKIWNAARLIFLNLERSGVEPSIPEAGALETLEDRWIASRLNHTAAYVDHAFTQHRYHEVAETLYHFFWHDLCDWYLEIKKLRLGENTGLTNDWRNLLHIFGAALRLLHPIMPFLTEELWHKLGQTSSISLAAYPQPAPIDAQADREMAILQDMITAARTLRADHKLDKKLILEGVLYTYNGARWVAESQLDVLEKLANVKLSIRSDAAPQLDGAVRSTPDFDLRLETPRADGETQRPRIEKESRQFAKLIENIDRQLSNEKFLSGAPAHVVESLRRKRAEYEAQLEKNRLALAALE
jgi:valyl-tRNA synthetase